MLLHNTQENDNNLCNMEFHTAIKKQIIIIMKNTLKKNCLPLSFRALGLVALSFVLSLSTSFAAGSKSSKFGGVQVGAITYSYRSMADQSLNAVLNYVVQSGLSSVELMGDVAERYAGVPQSKDPLVIRQWRTSVSMDKFREIKKMFKSKGIKINILKLGDKSWSDEEIDYAFNACEAVGAIGISMEISEEAAKRFEPFGEKHKKYVIFHNHGQPGDPNFSFDKVLAYGPKLMLNFDAGHYFGATGLHPNGLIERLHDRIISIHIKDKTGPKAADPNKNQPFGQGETPVGEMLKLIQKNNWPISCDIELEYTVPKESDAVKEVVKCVAFCKAALVVK
jgi:sugar phosphate isomerase/epimerase